MFWNRIFKHKKKNTSAASSSGIIDSGQVKVVVRTDLGNIRLNNEDNGLFYRIADEKISREKGYLLLVADGMGGHQAGEVASRMAAEIISQEYFKSEKNGGIEKSLRRAFVSANQQIYRSASSNKEQYGMGTTCTALVIVDQKIFFGHVGDSRAYLWKNNQVHRITVDHTYVQELVKSGEITAAEAETHPKRNILTNAMGTKPEVVVDTGTCPLSFETGDRLLLCSDGLYDYLNDTEIGQWLSNHTDIAEAAEKMIQEAKQRGGHDNITIVLAQKNAHEPETPAKETRDIDLPVTKELDLP